RGHRDTVMCNLFDAPGAGTENDGISGAAFEDHFFVELADAGSPGCACEEDSEETSIGNGAAVDDGDFLGTFARRNLVGDAVPRDAWTEFREFIRGITAGEHIED